MLFLTSKFDTSYVRKAIARIETTNPGPSFGGGFSRKICASQSRNHFHQGSREKYKKSLRPPPSIGLAEDYHISDDSEIRQAS